MEIRIIIIIICILIARLSYCQNLVPNNHFEDNSKWPIKPNQLSFAVNWIVPGFGGTPDYFCKNPDTSSQSNSIVNISRNFAGNQNAFDGKCYAGLFFLSNEDFSQREYIQVRLKSPLKSGKSYAISVRVSFADNSNFSIDFISVCFSKISNLRLNKDFTPVCERPVRLSLENSQADSLNWVEVKNKYLAEGGEEYFTIGLFSDLRKSFYKRWITDIINPEGRFGKNEFKFAYYYIDNVTVIEEGAKTEFSHENN